LECDRAIALRRDYPEAYNNQGVAQVGLDRFVEAMASFDAAIRLRSGYPEALWNKSTSLLLAGDYEQAWPLYEARLAMKHGLARPELAGMPRWDGKSPVAGKTIIVHAEQGLGDTLQFCRYVPMLAQRCRIIFDVQRPLRRLLSGLPGVERIITQDEPLPEFDAWIPLMSLPLAFRTTLATIPATIPYLTAEPERMARWRHRLTALSGRKIGLVWAGAANNRYDRRRSMALQQLAPLGAIPGLQLISLQHGEPAGQARTPPPGMVVHDWRDELDEFADVAALIENLDLVITVDTAVAHLAGALGKPVWVLACDVPDWRWLREHTDSPWYPTVRLFRQPTPGDWTSVVDDVVKALRTPD
jgi:tetratricopeptide (TPR) repeat protein